MPVSLKNGIPWMDPGKLRHRITFLDQQVVETDAGNEAQYLAGDPPERAYAEIAPVRGTDKVKAGQEVEQVLIMVTIRYRASVNAARRIQMPNGHVLVIQAVQNVALMNMWMELTCLGLAGNV